METLKDYDLQEASQYFEQQKLKDLFTSEDSGRDFGESVQEYLKHLPEKTQ